MDVQGVFSSLAERMMTKFGSAATLTRVSGNTYDPLTGGVAAGTTSTSTILAVLEKREVEADDGKKAIETTLKSNSALALNDRVTLAGKTYVVQSVEETAPTGTAFFWVAVVKSS